MRALAVGLLGLLSATLDAADWPRFRGPNGSGVSETTGLPCVYYDERFTSFEAEASMLEAGLTKKKRKARRDRVAAQILLQTYLDAGWPTEC